MLTPAKVGFISIVMDLVSPEAKLIFCEVVSYISRETEIVCSPKGTYSFEQGVVLFKDCPSRLTNALLSGVVEMFIVPKLGFAVNASC